MNSMRCETGKILCFGDSNTFGYDPRSWLGDRYDSASRWVDLLQAGTGREVINAGENGRQIPRSDFALDAIRDLILAHGPELSVIMLGTNDLLQGADPERVSARMERFLRHMPGALFLIAPPPLQRGTWVEQEALITASRQLGPLYRQLSGALGISFADSGSWQIPLAFDGVHFSEEGHRIFAQRLAAQLPERRHLWDISP